MNQQQKKIQRQERILSRLDDLGYATRKQIQVIEGLGGDRNAHRILHDMEKDKLISSVRREQKVYFLSGSGKNFIGSTKELKQSRSEEHTSELQSRGHLVCRLLLEKKKRTRTQYNGARGK